MTVEQQLAVVEHAFVKSIAAKFDPLIFERFVLVIHKLFSCSTSREYRGWWNRPMRVQTYVHFGSFLALHSDNTRTAALERIAVVRYGFCGSQLANVRFSPKRTLLPRENSNFQGPLSARSGRGDQINSALLASGNLPDGQVQK